MSYPIGILALQGDYQLHFQTLRRISQNPVLVRSVQDLRRCDGLILPGGESTTMRKLALENGLWEKLKEFGREKPVMGTCAGAILLAQQIEETKEPTLGLIDIKIKRNAYGRQINSFIEKGKIITQDGAREFEMVFIRAPVIERVGAEVEEIGFLGTQAVMVQNPNILALTFHPELTSDTGIHHYFINNFLTNRAGAARLSR